MLISIMDGFKAVYNSSSSINLTFDLNDVLPSEVEQSDYYQYVGSLTTPPCTQGIFWTVFEKPIKLSSRQVYLTINTHYHRLNLTFFPIKLKVMQQNSIRKNFRYPQKLNKRIIHTTKFNPLINNSFKNHFKKNYFILIFIILNLF